MADLSEIKARYGDHWTGPFGVKIPWEIRTVPSEDSNNHTSWRLYDSKISVWSDAEPGWTEPAYRVAYTAEEYRRLFCGLHADGNWYWRYTTQAESDDADYAAWRVRPFLFSVEDDGEW